MHTHETKIYIAVLTGLVVLVVLMIFFIMTIVSYQRKKTAFQQQKLKEEFNFLDKERERISFDLHDDLGASLSALKFRLQMLKGLSAYNISVIENSELLIDEIMQKLRQISLNMMPRILQRLGLNEALKELIGLMTFSSGIKVNYHCEIETFADEMAIHIYRISQEILNNIVKHSKATLINFAITKTAHGMDLKVKDNGVGFNKNVVIKKSGLGMHNIAARASLLKAKVYLTTEKGKGVDYLIQIPVK